MVKAFEDSRDYAFGCPEGTWHARLDGRRWGKSANLMLYFTDTSTNEKYWFSVFSHAGYKARQGGPSFKTDVQEGDVLVLTTRQTAGGGPYLVAAAAA